MIGTRAKKKASGWKMGRKSWDRWRKGITERTKVYGERKTRQVGLPGKGCVSSGALSIHLSLEYLKELKCKSGKLNPLVQCKQRLLQNRQSCSSSLLNSQGWETTSVCTGFICDGLKFVMSESLKDCRCSSHKPAKVQVLIRGLSKPDETF